MKAKPQALPKKKKTDKKSARSSTDRQNIPMRRTPTTAEAPAQPATLHDQATPSDQARDDQLRHELTHGSSRSSDDRHRHRLTATEAEEDDAVDNEDEAKNLDELLRQIED
jgi:hypothetical protein